MQSQNGNTALVQNDAIGTRRYLIAEHCDNALYSGWHLYLRDSKGRQQRNVDGEWGWLRGINRYSNSYRWLHELLGTFGITLKGDGTCDYDGIAEIARRFPIPRQRIGGKPRGCIEVDVDEFGRVIIPSA